MNFIEVCKFMVNKKMSNVSVITKDNINYEIMHQENSLNIDLDLAQKVVKLYDCLDAEYKKQFEKLSAYKILQITIDLTKL